MDKDLPCIKSTFQGEGGFIDSSINIFDSLETPADTRTK
jgi:hypothetical protein